MIRPAAITLKVYNVSKIDLIKYAPQRPFVDSIGSVTYNLSKALEEITNPQNDQKKNRLA